MNFPLFTGVGAGIAHSHLISWCQGLTLASRRQGRLLPLMWGGGYISRAGREEGIAATADKIVKALLIPHDPPLSCSLGGAMWCPTTATSCGEVAAVRRRGSMRGLLIWLLQGSSIPEMLQVLGKWSLSMLLPLKKASRAASSLSYTPGTWQ